ncbi:acyl-CoA thioesterase [Nakamurella deserti]|uniref:acyl-CoA thioesterase n=1 Tax=Nakamurella deserti TaxID=2164074 RepID=UPI000DBE7AF0|nr:acyl-CoA thioesterase II [Nakamurella deserti]
MTDGSDRSSAGPAAAPERDTDGVLRGQVVLDALVRLLTLEQTGPASFRGYSPPGSGRARVFGGQVASQALVAAARTVPADRQVHSLHAYFLRPGMSSIPIEYEVDRLRDGTSFTTRRVLAQQNGQTTFAMSASFQIDEAGLDHTETMPDVPAPESLPTLAERVAGVSREIAGWRRAPRAFDVRYVSEPPWVVQPAAPGEEAHSRIWFKADGVLPDDPVLHVCLLAYLSDVTLLEGVLTQHGLAYGGDDVQLASLDHAMWFHRPLRADEWLLYDVSSPSTSGGRGLGIGKFYDRAGQLVATVVQEGLMRLR